MGIKFMALAIDAEVDNSGQKLVLLMLANHCNDHTRQCNPSQKLLAQECQMGFSTLKNHIAALVSKGLVSINHVFLSNQQKSNSYTLHLDGSSILATPCPESGYLGVQNLATEPEEVTRKEKIVKTSLKPDEVSEDVWQDFCTHRGQKKALITKRVINGIAEQAIEAGWTLDQAMTEMVTRNWMSFKADWVKSKTPTAKQETPDERRKRLAFM